MFVPGGTIASVEVPRVWLEAEFSANGIAASYLEHTLM